MSAPVCGRAEVRRLPGTQRVGVGGMKSGTQLAINRATLRAVGADAFHAAGLDGRGIVIAIADYGFDLLHPAFRDGSGHTRFAALWDQNQAGEAVITATAQRPTTGRTLAGTLEAVAINALIEAAERAGSRAEADARYDPHAHYYGRTGVTGGAHGTLMASIAAGSPHGQFAGVAPDATLLGVQLALPDTAWREEDASGRPSWLDIADDDLAAWTGWRSYDAAAATVAAIRWLYDRACALGPAGIVLNISLGTWAGAHDGNSPVETELARIAALSEQGSGPPCIVVVGAGNAGLEQGHVSATVTPSSPTTFDWVMNGADPSQNKLEIWYRSPTPLAVGLAIGDATFEIAPGDTRSLKLAGRRIGVAEHTPALGGGLSRVRIALYPPAFADLLPLDGNGQITWTLTASTAGDTSALLHGWLERDDGAIERSTLRPFTPASTLSCITAAAGAIVVGGYHLDVGRDGAAPRAQRFGHASHGPLPWVDAAACEQVPHLAAPAHGVVGACSKSDAYAYTSGTSAAAALVSGATALLLQQAAIANTRATRSSVLAALLGRDRPAGGDAPASWDGQLGLGCLSLAPPGVLPATPQHSALSRTQHAGTHSRA